MLVGLDLQDFGSLGVLLGNEGQDGSRELLNNSARTFETDGVTLRLSLGEASQAGTAPGVRGTTSLLNERGKVGACELLLAIVLRKEIEFVIHLQHQ